jgi:hypothetical protein
MFSQEQVSTQRPEQIFRAIDERWGIEYPATNNAVVNGGFVATACGSVVVTSRERFSLPPTRQTSPMQIAMRPMPSR